ncbi:MAG: tripartite tricarboxylate transporter permease [Proteobacteria bacterium]|nr:tripartite tricarboxylate transporter permease [Pseudomonadota bacterium]MBU1740076.1 tripartite tricarboxylate transporter permease [Pseudomonadota bacterium]
MEVVNHLLFGFQVVLQPINLFYCFLGVLVGTLIGVLPGIGPIGAMAILLPSTYHVEPVTGIILLAGIYYGAMYGGSTTSIMVNIPGEAASVVTCLDGYQMARQGRAGPALGISAMGSFIGGTFGLVLLMFLVNPLASFAMKFGPPEYVGIMLVGLCLVTYLAKGSMLKAVIMAVLGLILGCVGTDLVMGKLRFTLGLDQLSDGLGIVPMVMGLFGVSEVLLNLEKSSDVDVLSTKIKNLFPSWQDWKRSLKPIIRGSFLGFGLGILPGGGSIISSFASYTMEKKLSKNPEKFGHGAIEGVAGPETANNAATSGAFVPLLAFGIPPNVVIALLLGALLMHGVTPGPLFMTQHPKIFWGIIASMYLGNAMLLILNLPLIPMWVRLLKVPYRIMFPLIILFCLIGVYTIQNSIFDVIIMLVFSVIGYVMKKYEFEEAPLVLAFILGPMIENAFRQSLIISDGNLFVFFTRPISAVMVSAAILLFMLQGLTFFRRAREKVARGEGVD